MSIADLLEEAESEVLRDRETLKEEMTFAEYLDIVSQSPTIASLSHNRVYKMIADCGIDVSDDRLKPNHYKFFENELFGLDEVFHQLVEEYFSPAARRLDIRKRILMFVGPVGGGKSTIVTLLKRQLEGQRFYAIDGCPMFEEPLHLLPYTKRTKFAAELGVIVEGELCPVCQDRLDNEWGGQISRVKIVAKKFSERHRIGIGTFKPADPKSVDVAQLIGHVDLSKLVDPNYRGESDPRAYRFDGELNVASRGLIEMIEMLKLEKQFLYELNTVAGEQNIKVPGFALVYVDLLVVSHTNEYEFKSYFSDPSNEAMIDRIFVVRVPYNLRVSDEVKIYDKLIKQAAGSGAGNSFKEKHIAPQTLKIASMFAVLSRLKTSAKSGLTNINKLKLYDGEQRVGEWEQKHVREIREEGVNLREGMDGLSPRFIINRLSSTLVKDKDCVNPLDAIRSLWEGVKTTLAGNSKELEELKTILDTVRGEYDQWVMKRVQRAFVDAYEESSQTLLDNYLQNVDAFCSKTKVRDPITEEEVAPDEKLMSSIEEQIGISGESKRKEFREGVMRSVASCVMRGQKFTLTSNSVLQEAIEKKLFGDLKDLVKVTTSTKTPNEEQQKRINAVLDRLTDSALPDDERYCMSCGKELLKYAGQLLQR